MLGNPGNRVVNKKRIIGKMEGGEEERQKGLLTQKKPRR
jgi:hypothetical protein